MIRRAAGMVVLGVSCAACGTPSFAYVAYSRATAPPGPFSLSRDEVTMGVGLSARADATAFDDAGEVMEGDLDLIPDNPKVMRVVNRVGSLVVLTGMSVGTTPISVVLDGEKVGTVTANVVAQPTP